MLTSGGDSYTYDADGNTLTAGARAYTWNAANRMASVTLAPGTNPINYAYNGDGVLVSRAWSGQTTTYLQDLASSLPVVLRENGPSGQIDYTWDRGLLSQQDQTGYYTVLAAGIGSVQALANTQGQVAGLFAYDSFGNPQGTPGGTATTNYHFAGEQTDPLAGLVNLRARSYDPHVGRFVSRDRLVQGGSGTQGFHRYAYVGNDPAGLTDPTGKTSCSNGGVGLDTGVVTSALHIDLPPVLCVELPQPPKIDLVFNPNLGTGCLWTPPSFDNGPLDSFPELGGQTIFDSFPEQGGGVFVSADGSQGQSADQDLLQQARNARDAVAEAQGRKVAVVTGGYNVDTGEVEAGCSGGPLGCVENDVVDRLGGNPSNVQFTEAIRPRTGLQFPICANCQAIYSPDQFPEGTQFQEGPWLQEPTAGAES